MEVLVALVATAFCAGMGGLFLQRDFRRFRMMSGVSRRMGWTVKRRLDELSWNKPVIVLESQHGMVDGRAVELRFDRDVPAMMGRVTVTVRMGGCPVTFAAGAYIHWDAPPLRTGDERIDGKLGLRGVGEGELCARLDERGRSLLVDLVRGSRVLRCNRDKLALEFPFRGETVDEVVGMLHACAQLAQALAPATGAPRSLEEAVSNEPSASVRARDLELLVSAREADASTIRPILLRTLEREDAVPVRLVAARALGPEGVPALVSIFTAEAESDDDRCAAAEAIGASGDLAAVGPLRDTGRAGRIGRAADAAIRQIWERNGVRPDQRGAVSIAALGDPEAAVSLVEGPPEGALSGLDPPAPPPKADRST